MKNLFHSARVRFLSVSTKVVVAALMLAAANTCVYAQGENASGTVTGSGSGPYSYSLTFSDAPTATSPVGSVWYSWIPGQFFLPGVPSTASAPTGWTATISANSVQYVASSPAFDIGPGQTLSGFGYTATFSP